MRCGSMPSSSQPGSAEQAVLCLSYAGLLLHRSHCLRCSGRLQIRALGRAPRQGTDQIRRSAGDCGRIPCSATERHGPHAKMTLSLAMSCRWRQSQRGGRGSRAPVSEPARSGNRARQSPTSAGSRTARMVPARLAPTSEPLRWWSRSRHRPWLPQPVLAILVSMLDQRQGRHLLVLQ
jgi:hypothetical protein